MIEIGEIRDELAKDLHKMLDLVINRMAKHPRIYWILIHADWDNMEKPTTGVPLPWQNLFGKQFRPHKTDIIANPQNVLRTNLVIMPTKPTHPVVGTACVEIDNKQGRATWLWGLPKDAPRPGIEQQEGSENEGVFQSARKSGAIIYG